MSRSSADIVADLAALAARQAELTAELAESLRAAPAPAPLPAPAELPAFLTTAGAARLLGVSTRHLARLRKADVGPIPHHVGQAIRYRREEVEAWGRKYHANAVQLPSGEAPEAPSAAPRPAQSRAQVRSAKSD